MASKKSNDQNASIEIASLNTATLVVRIVGTSPMIFNSMGAKVMQQLLLPPKKKNRSEKESTLKHEPLEEYRRSPLRTNNPEAPTRIIFPAGGVKAAIAKAALDIPGANKSQIGRLCYVEGRDVSVFGIPQLLMSPVRNSDIARTPDVRTRAIMAEWAAEVAITFVRPNLTEQAVANLLAAAGIIVGLGDWRPEKGKGSFGQFRLAGEDDPQYARIVATGGRDVQDAALESPTPFDVESAELLEWFEVEVRRRGLGAA